MSTSDIRDYIEKRKEIEREVDLLKEDLKCLDVDFKDRVDIKAIKAARRIMKLKMSSNEESIDEVIDILSRVGIAEDKKEES